MRICLDFSIENKFTKKVKNVQVCTDWGPECSENGIAGRSANLHINGHLCTCWDTLAGQPVIISLALGQGKWYSEGRD